MGVKIEIQETACQGKTVMTGQAFYMDTMFSFRIYSAPPSKTYNGDTKKIPPGKYNYVAEEHIISPQSGKILQSSEKAKQLRKKLSEQEKKLLVAEANHAISTEEIDREKNKIAQKKEKLNKKQSVEDLNATGYKYLQDLKHVKKAVEELTKQLYANYQDDILKELGQTAEKDHLHARTAFDLYQNDFFRDQKVTTKKRLEDKKGMLKKACSLLNEKCISELTDADIKAALPSMGKKTDEKLGLLEKFLDFCGEQGILRGQNPVSRFYQAEAWKEDAKRNGEKGNLYPKASTHLKEKCEIELYKLIKSSIEDDMSLAIPLACGAGLSVIDIIDIEWQNIEITGNQVRIQDYKPNYTGGTHNYIRPPTRTAADLIIMKYNILVTKIGKSLKKMKVVPISGRDRKEQKANLTKYFKEMLLAAGVTQSEFALAVDPKHPKAEGGAGYKLLKKHYEYVLQDRCGVDLDSSVGCYLRGARIFDTTGDYYRALSDETGDHHLQTIMNRDDLFVANNGSVTLSSEKCGEMRKFSITKGPPGTLTEVLTRKKLWIPKGGEIVVCGEHYGVAGEIRFSRKKVFDNGVEYTELY